MTTKPIDSSVLNVQQNDFNKIYRAKHVLGKVEGHVLSQVEGPAKGAKKKNFSFLQTWPACASHADRRPLRLWASYRFSKFAIRTLLGNFKYIWLAFLIVILLILHTSLAEAAYRVLLKNGREFVAARYWEEGKRIMFDTGGGVFGLEKNSVSKIEKTNQPANQAPAQKPDVEEPPPLKTEEPKKGAPTPKETVKKDDEIVKEFRLLEERFSRVNDLTDDEAHKLSDDLSSFRRKLAENNLSETYKDEYDAANTLIRAIDGLLKARSQ